MVRACFWPPTPKYVAIRPDHLKMAYNVQCVITITTRCLRKKNTQVESSYIKAKIWESTNKQRTSGTRTEIHFRIKSMHNGLLKLVYYLKRKVSSCHRSCVCY